MSSLRSWKDKLTMPTPRIPPPASAGIMGGQPSATPSYAHSDVSVWELVSLASSALFSLVLLICSSCLAAFQHRWLSSASGLSGYLIFVALFTLLAASVLLALSLLSMHSTSPRLLKAGAFIRLPRPGFIFRLVPLVLVAITTLAQTISIGTSKGCKHHDQDPAKVKDRDAYVSALGSFCAAKGAATAFLWFLLVSMSITAVLFFLSWRSERARGNHAPAPPEDLEAQADAPYDPAGDYDEKHAAAEKQGLDDGEAGGYYEADYTLDGYQEDDAAEMAYYRARYGSVTASPGPRFQPSFDYGSYPMHHEGVV